jgi:hypothetical protein
VEPVKPTCNDAAFVAPAAKAETLPEAEKLGLNVAMTAAKSSEYPSSNAVLAKVTPLDWNASPSRTALNTTVAGIDPTALR